MIGVGEESEIPGPLLTPLGITPLRQEFARFPAKELLFGPKNPYSPIGSDSTYRRPDAISS
jgi:hypothetical protein